MTDPEADGTARRGRRVLAATTVLALLLAPALVVGMMLLDGARVQHHDELAGVELGRPLPWVTQDQGALSPPLPYRTTLLSPWENPTTVDPWALAVDVALVLVILAPGLLVVRRAGRARPRSST